MNIGENAMKSNNSLITTVAYSINGRAAYALEGSVFIGGAVIKWLEEGLGVINNSQESEIMASSVEDTGGVYFVPAFTGLGAPYWNQHARGCIVGITRYTKKEHIVRAALEGIAYQCHDVAQAMNKDTGCRLEKIRVDGGASKNGMLMQFQADILNAVIERPVHGEMTALGAAMMSGLGSGMWKSLDELKALSSKDEEYKPSMKEETREMLLDGWRRAVDRSLDWAEE